MKLKVKALQSVVDYDDGAMVVLNTGDSGELTEAKATELADAGKVKITSGKKKAEAKEPEETGYAAMSVPDLTELATELEVMPETGSGKDGAVVKSDIVAALEQADADSAPA